jgi:hypothetical protein
MRFNLTLFHDNHFLLQVAARRSAVGSWVEVVM